MKQVAAVACNSYRQNEVDAAVRQVLHKLNYVLPENKTVLLKPNIMSQNRPEQHTMTHYSLIDALCRLLQERNCRIQIGESISFYQTGLTRTAFTCSKMAAVAEKYGATLVAFDETPLVGIKTELPYLPELYLPQILLAADTVINVCKLKTHTTMRLSGAVKNLFGCLPGGYKQRIHLLTNNEFELADVFLTLHDVVRPSLSIMDAVMGLDGGPSAMGRPVKTARIFAAANAAALDVVAGRMIGYAPEEVPLLIRARERGMIDAFDRIEVLGNVVPVPFKHLIKGDLDRTFDKNSIFVKHTYVEPRIDFSRCTQCQRCVSACPTGAIKVHGDKLIVDSCLCINCYYCLACCPVGAIGVKASPMNQFMRMMRCLLRI